MEEKILEIEEKFKDEIEKAILYLKDEYSLIRTSRATPSLLNKIEVLYYNVLTPLNQVANIQVIEGTQLYIKPFDKSLIKEIENAINTSELNLPPVNDGVGIRLILPKLTEERRKEISKDVAKKAENAKIVIRNKRRVANDSLKELKLQEDLEISSLKEIQNHTDEAIKRVDEVANLKTKEVMTI